MHKHAWLLGGSGGIPPEKILNLDPLRLLLNKSGTNSFKQHFDDTYLLSVTCKINIDGTTIITILNLKISGGGGKSRAPPLCRKP